MAIGNFIKNNLALVAGLAVPVLLVAGFLISAQIGRLSTEPPRHLAYFVVEDTDAAGSISLRLDLDANGNVIATLTPVETNPANSYRPPAQRDVLMSYDFAAGKLEEIPVIIPDGQTSGVFIPSEVAGLRLKKGPVAPDGYALSYGSGRRGFIGDIFSYNYGYNYRASKNSASYRFDDEVPVGRVFRYYAPGQSTRFLGWGIDRATGDTP